MKRLRKVIALESLLNYENVMATGIGVRKNGIAVIELPDGTIAKAEVHWYEAHGIGKVKLKVKRWL